MVKFRVSGLWIGIDVLGVEAVVRCPENLETPSRSRDVAGLLLFRGRRVPLIELAPWLGLKGYFPGEERHVIVLNLVKLLLGVIVGDVEGLAESSGEPVLPVHSRTQSAPDLLRAVQTEEGILNLLEPEVFFRREHVDAFMAALGPPESGRKRAAV